MRRLLLCGALVACHATRGASVDDHPPGRSDCPWVALGCDDDDGCAEGPDARPPPKVVPQPALREACGTAAPFDDTVAQVARELREKPDLTKLSIRAPTASCANAAREAIGADPSRVEIRIEPDVFVLFGVSAWQGRTCP